MELGHIARADGRWRIYAFADRSDPREPGAPLRALCDYLATAPDSPLNRYTPAGADIDEVFDVRAIVRQSAHELSPLDLPALLLPRKGRLNLRDYEKAFCPARVINIFDARGIDAAGCAVIVRPDQYVAQILPLSAYDELGDFFAAFMIRNVDAAAALAQLLPNC
jgi:phenol 2-monooxygenase